ncbi:MAG: hypothetical protein ACM3S1_07780 [Hyphomicrobiales bacterium]
MSNESLFDEMSGEYVRTFRLGWMARAKRDEERGVWIIRAVDHDNLEFQGEVPASLTAEEALDSAELLAP